MRRAKELGIQNVFQGVDDKLVALRKLAKARRVHLAEVACIGDDTPDAPMLDACGLGIAVADAHADALGAADLVTSRPGGQGAVREVCDWIMAARA
jgi:3-deoxy-D-manno-octulosonate 8-phosphate phosphatase (KDO 8-P phosphatase)